MKIYEVISYGIPDCCGTYGIYLTREAASVKMEELKEECPPNCDFDYFIKEREVK